MSYFVHALEEKQPTMAFDETLKNDTRSYNLRYFNIFCSPVSIFFYVIEWSKSTANKIKDVYKKN